MSKFLVSLLSCSLPQEKKDRLNMKSLQEIYTKSATINQMGTLERNRLVSVHTLGGNPTKLCLCSIYCLEKQTITFVLPEATYVFD